MSLSQLSAHLLNWDFKFMASISQVFACPGVASVWLQVRVTQIY